MCRCSSPARETLNGYDVCVNRSARAEPLDDVAGDVRRPVVGPVVDEHDVLDGLEHRRQHPRQVAGLVLDPEHARQPGRQRPVGPRPGDVVRRVALAVAQAGHRPRSRLSPLGSAVLGSRRPALAPGGVGRGRGDALGLVVERDVGRRAAGRGSRAGRRCRRPRRRDRTAPASSPRRSPGAAAGPRGPPRCGGRGAGPGPRTGGPCACCWPTPRSPRAGRARTRPGTAGSSSRPAGRRTGRRRAREPRVARSVCSIMLTQAAVLAAGRSRSPTTSVTCRRVVRYAAVASQRIAAARQRPRNHAIRGSLSTSSGSSSSSGRGANCGPSQSTTRVRSIPLAAHLPVSNQADGRPSVMPTLARSSSSVCRSTTHCDSADPRSPVSSAGTSGAGTCMPRACSPPASALVPLRPEPTTRTTRRLDTGHTLARAQSFLCSAIRSAYQSKDRLGVRCWVS